MNRRDVLKSALAALVACAVPWSATRKPKWKRVGKPLYACGVDTASGVDRSVLMGVSDGRLYRWEPTIRRDGALIVGIDNGTFIVDRSV